MTTTVIVKAHCAKEKEVVIAIDNDGKTVDTIRIQDGEEWSGVVYDERFIHVSEQLKAPE